MSASKKQSLSTPKVVGTVHSEGSLKRALRLRQGEVDLLELRADHFAGTPERLLAAIPKLPCPLILTVRHPAEGGAGNLSLSPRRELFRQFMSLAAYVDIELRSAPSLQAEIADARAQGLQVIISDHHFQRTPPLAKLVERRARAADAGGDIFKLAAATRSLPELITLATFLGMRGKPALSVMGMGEFGKVSRLLLARGGSALNYGYLDQAQVPGQWEATLLKKRLLELTEES